MRLLHHPCERRQQSSSYRARTCAHRRPCLNRCARASDRAAHVSRARVPSGSSRDRGPFLRPLARSLLRVPLSPRRGGVDPAKTPCELFRLALRADQRRSDEIEPSVGQSSNRGGLMSSAWILAFVRHRTAYRTYADHRVDALSGAESSIGCLLLGLAHQSGQLSLRAHPFGLTLTARIAVCARR